MSSLMENALSNMAARLSYANEGHEGLAERVRGTNEMCNIDGGKGN